MKLINKIINIFSFTIVSKQELKKLINENRNLINENLNLKDKNEKLSESKHVCPNKWEISTKNINHDFDLDNIKPLTKRVKYINDTINCRINKNQNSGDEYTEFTDKETVKDWAEKLYGDWRAELKTKQERFQNIEPFMSDKLSMLNTSATAVKHYSGSAHIHINSLLRNENIKDMDMYIRLCDKLIYEIFSAPKLSENIIVYRAVDTSTFENIISNIQKNGHFVENGFMSTTLLKDILVYDNNKAGMYCDYPYILKIYVDEGEVAVYSPLLCDRDDEHEMLFLHGGTLTIRNKAEIDEILQKIISECNYQNKKY